MPQYHPSTGTASLPDANSSYPTFPKVAFGRAVAIGIVAGFMGAFVMSASNKLEQFLTHRPNSYVPARTIGNHLGVSADFYSRNFDTLNNLHHYGMGMLAGLVRAILSYYGVMGPAALFFHTGIRILMDQTVELSADTSALPWTCPIHEQMIDVVHKGIYALVTGYLCDKLVRGVDWAQ